MKRLIKNANKGFTLIELLIVIAVLGVLAAIILIAINPAEVIERGRDAGRIAAMNQLGHSVSAYVVNVQQRLGSDTAFTATNFQAPLVNSGDLSKAIDFSGSAYSCGNSSATSVQNNICYNESNVSGINADFVVWTDAKSKAYQNKCTAAQFPRIVYSSTQGKAGVDCVATATTNPAPGDTLK